MFTENSVFCVIIKWFKHHFYVIIKIIWVQMSLINTANAGIFSADRSVEEYAKDIWNIKKVK